MTTDPSDSQPPAPAKAASGSRLASSLVAAGILLSRVAGLVREAVFSRYFGTSQYADVFRAGLRMPGVLQNLLGEGTLSASFIPVYSELIEKGRKEEAGRLAGAVFALLLAVAGGLTLIGIFFAPLLVSVFAFGFEGERRALCIQVVRIIFPMTGILVLSAWALGILNSHRRFFIAYVAPVVWNAAIIATLLFFGGRFQEQDRLLMALAWGALVGGVLQFAVQLPWVLRLERNLKFSFGTKMESVREVVRNAGPAIMGRGVVQLSGYVDIFLASLLATGGVAIIGYAQQLYILPVSLFGMSVAAAELPELSRQRLSSTEELRLRTNAGLERIAFFVVPSFVAFVVLGDSMVAMLFQRGEFLPADTRLVWVTLIGFAIGLVASTGTRLFSSTFFALRDTRTPARIAIVRVAFAAVLSFLLMTQFEPIEQLGLPGGFLSGVTIEGRSLGPLGITIGSGAAAWVEWGLLRRRLRSRIGEVGAGAGKLSRMFAAAGAAAISGWAIRLLIPGQPPIAEGVPVFLAFGLVYFSAASMLGLSEARLMRDRLMRMAGRG